MNPDARTTSNGSPRVLVLGGTSFIGPSVVQQLKSHGCKVAVFHRGNHEPDTGFDDVHHIHGDRARIEEFTDDFAAFKPDVVVDMWAMTEADAQRAVVVLESVAPRAVVLSSMDVYEAYDVFRGKSASASVPVPFSETSELRRTLYPYRNDPARTSDDPSKWMDEYDKILVEQAYLSAPGLGATVLRLPAVYGPGDKQHRFLSVSKRIHDGRHILVLDPGMASWRFVHAYVEDVAYAVVLAVLTDLGRDSIFNVGEESTPTVSERFRSGAAAVGWRFEVLVAEQADLARRTYGRGI